MLAKAVEVLLQGSKQAAVMMAAHDRGALVFEAFANSPPWFMTISGDPRSHFVMIELIRISTSMQ